MLDMDIVVNLSFWLFSSAIASYWLSMIFPIAGAIMVRMVYALKSR